MKKIRIAIFIRGLHNGGIEKVFETYFSYMDLEPFEIHIITHLKNNIERKKVFENMGCIIHELSPVHGSRINRINIHEYNSLFSSNSFDIVHNNMPEIFLPLYYARKKRIPIRILHAHSVYTGKIRNNKLKACLYKIGFKINRLQATRLVAVSREAAVETFGKKADVLVLSNAINPEHFRFNTIIRNDIRQSMGFKDEIIIGHLGRFESDVKNQDFLIDVIELLNKQSDKFRLLLIGEGKRKEAIKTIVEEKKLSEIVRFCGAVNNVNEYLMGMDVFLFPSKQEGFGIAALEAQASGLPCLVSDQVPRSVKVSENIQFLPINGIDATNVWAEETKRLIGICYKNYNVREVAADCIYKNRFDIQSNIKCFVELYMESTDLISSED